MFGPMIRFELKNIIREKMTIFMVFYPFILGAIGRLLIDYEVITGQEVEVTAILLTVITGFIFGAVGGFSLLDDRDDQVLTSIQISPVPVQWYIWFKVGFTYVLAVLGGFFMIWIVRVIDLSVPQILLVALLNALQVPFVMFIINAFSTNKIEGYVTMKGVGFLVIFPAIGFFYLDAIEWVFALAPAHWAAKALQYSILKPLIQANMVAMNLDFYGYLGLGMLYNLLLAGGAYAIFKKKNML